jgi:hypothetical protein
LKVQILSILSIPVNFCDDKSTQALEDSGGAHAAADAHRHHPVASASTLKLAQDGGGELRAGAAQGVAQGDGAAVDVDAVGV